MKLKKLLFTAVLLSVFATTLSAQQYNSSLGVRLGYENGFTFKQRLAAASATEFIVAISPKHFQLTGLYEYQQPIREVQGLDWYVGLGAHIGGIHKDKNRYDNSFLIGADLIGGLEYAFPQAPFNISLDWKPSFNFTNDFNDDWFSGFALSLRYTFR